MSETRILVTGANGQIGNVLTNELRKKFGTYHVLATDIQKNANDPHYEFLDILNAVRMRELIGDFGITQVYHLAAILSAGGEYNPMKTWNVNLNGWISVLEIARELGLDKVFFPSTIAVFGKTTPRELTPQHVPMQPDTIYGVSKVTGELLNHYYFQKYGIDVRSVRYPGIISYQSVPAGGTTDYAVEIFHAAKKREKYECFLAENTRLPMMYADDAIAGTIQLMDAPVENIKCRMGYNLAAMSFTPGELYAEIKNHYPDFQIEYKPDFRQKIAESWTEVIDDSEARKDWGWNHRFDLKAMVAEMVENV